MKARDIVQTFVCAAVVWGAAQRVEARSLTRQIEGFFGPSGIVLDVGASPTGEPLQTAQFSSASLATLGLVVQMLSSNAVEVPAISTAPGLTYRYDPENQLFERSSVSLGPVFVERAHTLGRGKFDLGFSYLLADFEEWKGIELDQLAFALQSNPNSSLGNATATVRFDRFTLRSHFAFFFATYGITDQWDANVLVPVIFTSLKARARVRLDNPAGEIQGAEQLFAGSDDKTGIGDLLLRTKYHLFRSELVSVAVGSSLRIPTGNEENFQGTGDTIIEPFVALSRESGRFHLHLNGGTAFNLDDSDRSRFHYAGGVIITLLRQLAFSLDVIGSSNLTTDRISRRIPLFASDTFPSTSPLVPSGFTRVSRNLHTDLVDLAIGLKGNIRSVTAFVTFFVPLTDDGLRADWMPTAGLQVNF
jgi:hypothetical protein